MDKSSSEIRQEKTPGCTVHRCPKFGQRSIHRNYGLWIISSRRNQRPNIHYQPHPYIRYFEFYAISQLLDGDAFLRVPGKEDRRYKPGQGVLMVPEYEHYYGGGKSYFTEDTIRFTGPVADHLYKSGVIRPGIINIGKHRCLLPVMDMAEDPSANSQIKANFALQKLLIDIYFENMQGIQHDHANEINDILKAIRDNPDKWWTLPELAEICGLSVDQFRNVFRGETGMTPKNYIDKTKMTRAGEQLCVTNESIASIARKCGYSDPYHFSRRFKQIMGCAPGSYRKTHL